MIDFATLTGAMEIALGAETTGFMSNQDALANSLIRAGEETFERVWRMPLFEEYKEQLKSDIADMRNIGGRPAGSEHRPKEMEHAGHTTGRQCPQV